MRIPELDGLRGIAVLATVYLHYLAWLPITGSHNGWLGVDLFFVLSGFLITSILVNLREKEHYFSTFYARRALRIFPPYFIAIAVYLATAWIMGQPGTLNLWCQYIFYYTSLYVGQPPESDHIVPEVVHLGLAVLWSLSVEEIYYTFWAPIVRYTSHKVFATILAGMIVAAPLLRWWLHTPSYPETYTFYCRMDALAYGSVVALLMRRWRSDDQARVTWRRPFNWAAMAMAVATIGVWIYLKGDRANLFLATAGNSMADIALALIVFAVLRYSGSTFWGMRMLRAKWLRSIGMVSYSLYLFNYPIRYVVGMWVAQWGLSRHGGVIVTTILAFAVSVGVAYGLWYGVESRVLRWKDSHVPSPAHP
jgi:peptidoglycan/LPS O-acetylase OafA/YrhL